MARKDITDGLVCRACLEAHQRCVKSIDLLVEQTRQPKKVCRAAMERSLQRGYIECGVSIDTAWIEDAGRALLEAEAGGAWK